MIRNLQKMGSKNLLQTPKKLIAFDFDHTIANDNTDIVARELVGVTKIPENIQILYKSDGWIPYMQEIFKILLNNGFKRDNILKAVTNIPEVPGMINCIKYLNENNFDVIIISDSNSEFISNWNLKNEINNEFVEIFTNPAEFDNDELLLVRPFHTQTECQISSINLCKGKVLNDYIKIKKENDKIIYENIFMVGDGYHDICPMLRLNIKGFACPRIGYSADKCLEKTAQKISTKMYAKVLRWNDGNDLLQLIKENI